MTEEKPRKKKAYVHAVGLGMGSWQVCSDQEDWFLEVFLEILQGNYLKNISDVNFSWFRKDSCGGVTNGKTIKSASGNDIKIIFSRRDPAEKLEAEDKDKLLVCCYAWDSNSFPGNEYWCGLLQASGDPAAASCSTITEIQNAYINPGLCAFNLFVIDPEKEKKNGSARSTKSRSNSVKRGKEETKMSRKEEKTPRTEEIKSSRKEDPKSPRTDEVKLSRKEDPKSPRKESKIRKREKGKKKDE